jgi:hypothetical protein
MCRKLLRHPTIQLILEKTRIKVLKDAGESTEGYVHSQNSRQHGKNNQNSIWIQIASEMRSDLFDVSTDRQWTQGDRQMAITLFQIYRCSA